LSDNPDSIPAAIGKTKYSVSWAGEMSGDKRNFLIRCVSNGLIAVLLHKVVRGGKNPGYIRGRNIDFHIRASLEHALRPLTAGKHQGDQQRKK
jgi:hypothetical protein